MAKWSFFYLIRIEFLGFRYHGWQKQPGVKSVHGMVDKTMLFVLGHDQFKTLGCGRTDARVSANDYAFELFLNEDWITDQLLDKINKNLPPDIRAKSVSVIDAQFNIIQHAKVKEYHYHFTSGNKPNPFSAPFVGHLGKSLDVEAMSKAAKKFEGTHNFKRFVRKPSEGTVFERNVLLSSIERDTDLKGSFISEDMFTFKVRSKGFMRYQVRLMMGALTDVGKGIWSVDDLEQALHDFKGDPILHAAPSSGLVLHRIEFQ